MTLGGQCATQASLDVMIAWPSRKENCKSGPWWQIEGGKKNQTPQTLRKAEKHEKYYTDLDISDSSSPFPQLTKRANTTIIRQFLSNACSCIKISSFPLRTSNSPSSPGSLFSFLAFHHKVSQGLEFHFLDNHTHDAHFQLPSYLWTVVLKNPILTSGLSCAPQTQPHH